VTQPNRIQSLDLIRTLALLSVVISHIYQDENSWIEDNFPFWTSWFVSVLRAPVTTGGFGVCLFLLLSGFLMARSSAREPFREFLKRRGLRIYPLYFAAIMARYLLFILTTDSPDWRIPIWDLVGVSTLFGDFWNTGLFLGLVDWSLRVEVVAYSAVALTILVIPAHRRARILTITSCILVVVPTIPSVGFTSGYLNIHLPLFVAGFALGSIQDHGSNSRLTVVSLFNVLLALVSAGVHRQDLAVSIFFYSNIFVSFAVFMAIRRMTSYQAGRIVTYLSETSYGIYLMHNWLVLILADSIFGSRSIVARTISLLLIVALAKPLHTYIERPAMRLARRRLLSLNKS
jgi:peptidoglycan/LPS O-acetylase OafA/YrhL